MSQVKYTSPSATEQTALFREGDADSPLISQHNSAKAPETCPHCHSEQFDKALDRGVPVSEVKRFQSRAQAKYVTDHITRALVELESPLMGSYNRTLRCAYETDVINGHAVTKYCKNRWCLVCNRIRTAQLIDEYLPVVQTWDEKYMVTLTVPNCGAYWLPKVIDSMADQFYKIRRSIQRTHDRNPKMIRKLEVTYRVEEKDYHPHFHVIVNDRLSACLLYSMWLERFPEATYKAQDVRKADEGSLKELFKYFTKMFSKSSDGSYRVDVEMLDVIFNAMYKKRTFMRYGFKLSDYQDEIEAYQAENEPTEPQDELDEIAPVEEQERLTEPSDGHYKWIDDDWYHWTTGEALSGYIPSDRVNALIQGIYFHGQPFYQPPDG